MPDFAKIAFDAALLIGGVIVAWATLRSSVAEHGRKLDEHARTIAAIPERCAAHAERLAFVERDAAHLDKSLSESLRRIEEQLAALSGRIDSLLRGRDA